MDRLHQDPARQLPDSAGGDLPAALGHDDGDGDRRRREQLQLLRRRNRAAATGIGHRRAGAVRRATLVSVRLRDRNSCRKRSPTTAGASSRRCSSRLSPPDERAVRMGCHRAECSRLDYGSSREGLHLAPRPARGLAMSRALISGPTKSPSATLRFRTSLRSPLTRRAENCLRFTRRFTARSLMRPRSPHKWSRLRGSLSGFE